MNPAPNSLGLTPRARLVMCCGDSAAQVDPELISRLTTAVERGSGYVLLLLGAGGPGGLQSPVLSWWHEFGALYIAGVCVQAGLDAPPPGLRVPCPPDEQLERLTLSAPPMQGAEYLTLAALSHLWYQLDAAFDTELSEAACDVQEFLKRHNPAWNLVGRVHFNLAENKKDPDSPFAFLATYTTRLSAQAKAQHVPLGQALREYSGAASKDRLLSLLLPVQRAAESCLWLKTMVDGGELFHPLRWSPREALCLLRDVPKLEAAGVVVRMPAAWSGNRPPRPRVKATVGGGPPTTVSVGLDAMLDFRTEVTVDGEPLTAAEIRELLAQSDGLALVRGRWIELDRERLQKTMDRFGQIERSAAAGGLSFGEAMRLLSSANIAGDDVDATETAQWSQVSAGPWLANTLKGMRGPEGLAAVDPGDGLRGTLRPYQQAGVRWLYLLSQLRLGACLADDMGLGKTLQVLSLLVVLKRQAGKEHRPCLLVAPASLLDNWAAEIERFTPGLQALVAHSSALPAAELKAMPEARLAKVDLVITSYGSLLRLPWLTDFAWRVVVLDEAQAIKNPDSKQTRAVKKLRAGSRIALTGTPVENRVSDLWSIFDFVNPGLLGSAKEFVGFTKRIAAQPDGFRPLRELVRPYILRRLKTDKTVITDLPDKTELKVWCPLSRPQAALYEQAVKELASTLRQAQGIKRRGLVLSFLMRFKQICNHPSQWLGDGVWNENDSGKLARLRDIAEVIAARQEKMLVFTQFREIIEPLTAFLGSIFQRPGLVLHGGTEVKERKNLVRRFQDDESIGFFILSLKAGGSGLNLTAASHVVHFDRWWNPAVENQATDRAFRIGQTKNVLVHKFVCRGTLEDKIDELIESKRSLSQNILEGGADLLLTEMKDDELLGLVALDINKALKET